jgi:protein O-mannosyl-transferase
MLKRLTRSLLPLIILVIIGAVSYVNALPNSFHYDDFPTIVQNGAIRKLARIPSYFFDTSTWTVSRLRDWRPVVLTTFALNYAMAGTNPIIFRLTNLIFHIGSAFFLYLILKNILGRPSMATAIASLRSRVGLALAAALLFLVHPADSEVVNYIFARSTLLATFFLVAGFYCYLRGPHGETRPRFLAWEVAGLVCYALGLVSKATAITLPLLLLVFEWVFLNPGKRGPWRLLRAEPKRLQKYIPLLLVACAYVAIRQIVAPRALAHMATHQGLVYIYFLTQIRAWVYYLELWVWPALMLSDYSGFGWSQSFWEYRVLVSFGIVTAVLGIAFVLWKKQPVISFFIFWYFITLLPEASIVPLSDAVNAYRFYPSNVGTSIATVTAAANVVPWLWHRMWSRINMKFERSFRAASFIMVLGALMVLTWQRNEVFRDEGTYWSDILRKDPGNVRAMLGLGSFLLEEKTYAQAQQLFERAVRMSPKNSLAYLFRGYLNALLDKNIEALADYNQAAQLDPQEPSTYVLRGEAYENLKNHLKAIADFNEVLRLRPQYIDAYVAKARTLQAMGDDRQAYNVCATGMAVDPDQASFYLCLGRILQKENRPREALRIYQRGIARGLENQELWYKLALLYQQIGMYQEASEAFGHASRLMAQTSDEK